MLSGVLRLPKRLQSNHATTDELLYQLANTSPSAISKTPNTEEQAHNTKYKCLGSSSINFHGVLVFSVFDPLLEKHLPKLTSNCYGYGRVPDLSVHLGKFV